MEPAHFGVCRRWRTASTVTCQGDSKDRIFLVTVCWGWVLYVGVALKRGCAYDGVCRRFWGRFRLAAAGRVARMRSLLGLLQAAVGSECPPGDFPLGSPSWSRSSLGFQCRAGQGAVRPITTSSFRGMRTRCPGFWGALRLGRADPVAVDGKTRRTRFMFSRPLPGIWAPGSALWRGTPTPTRSQRHC